MSRSLTTNMQSMATAKSVKPFMLFAGYFDSGTVYTWSGYGSLSWNGHTWLGTGTLLTVAPVQETEEVRATGTSFNLSGIPSAMISLALTENYQGRKCEMYLGAFDDAGAIIDDPCLIFSGRMDVMQIDPSQTNTSITLSAENRLIDLERPRSRRYTNEDQQADYSGDTGMAFVAGLQDATINWTK